MAPVRPARKYHVTINQGKTAHNLQVKTTDRFADGNATENMKVVNNIKWKLELDKSALLKKKHIRDAEASTKNNPPHPQLGAPALLT